jgi:hypothetical protein
VRRLMHSGGEQEGHEPEQPVHHSGGFHGFIGDSPR